MSKLCAAQAAAAAPRGRSGRDGSGASVYASAGADVSIGRQFYLTGEARYNLASGGMRDSYSLFDRIDLSGLQLITGVSLRW